MKNVLQWFKGKPLENIEALWPAFEMSVKYDAWIPGLSRRFAAALNKATAPKKLGREIEGDLDSIRTLKSEEWRTPANTVTRALNYGEPRMWADAAEAIEKLRARAKTPEQKEAVRRAAEVVADFAPVAEVILRLDSTRPKPVFTSLGVSPTITKTLTDARLSLVPSTIRMPPTSYELVEKKNPKTGKIERRWVAYLHWPENTEFDQSRFHRYDGQCESCGHAIKNIFNWLPILIDDKSGVPHALWIGRDCGERVFGIKSKGDLEFAVVTGGGAK